MSYIKCRRADLESMRGLTPEGISQDVLERAIAFLEMLPVTLPAPTVHPEPDGCIGFEWYAAPGKVFTLDLDANGDMTYAGLFGPGAETHGKEPLGAELPDALARFIQRACRS